MSFFVNPNPNIGDGGSGGEFDGTIPWGNVTNKPQAYPPTEHNHNNLYYTKDEAEDHVNFVRDLMEQKQGKVATNENDEPDYLQSKVDNVTLTIEGNELKVKSVDGLTIGIVNLNNWLSGTSGNLQGQINHINNLLASMTSGMNFLGKVESYSDLQAITTQVNGSVVVVLSDESRSNGRNMYVYSEAIAAWDFIGEFVFSDEFIKLKDTPASYIGSNGKYVRVDESNEKLIFDDIDYNELKNRPQSSITQIDGAVQKAHDHVNSDNLDGIDESDEGVFIYKGEEYLRKSDFSIPSKSRLYARLMSTKTYDVNETIRFNQKYSGDIPLTSDGEFTLIAGKAYLIIANFSLGFSSNNEWCRIKLVDIATGEEPVEAPNNTFFRPSTTTQNQGGSRTVSVIIEPLTTRKFGLRIAEHASGSTITVYHTDNSLTILEI